jgi:hypothetical protein
LQILIGLPSIKDLVSEQLDYSDVRKKCQRIDHRPIKPNGQCFFVKLLRVFLVFTDGASADVSALRFGPAAFDVLTLTTVAWPRPLPAASLWRICASAADQSVDVLSMAYLGVKTTIS